MTIKFNGVFTKYEHLGQYHIISLFFTTTPCYITTVPDVHWGNQDSQTLNNLPRAQGSTITGVKGGDFPEGGSGQ